MPEPHVAVIGAGIGGLAAALDLAVSGYQVTVLERQSAPGGKMRQVMADGAPVDAGPTVFTMRWVFEELCASAGTSLAELVGLKPAWVLARHAWDERARLDLFADLDASAEAIGQFAGRREALAFRDFSLRAERIYRTLERPFLRAQATSPLALVRAAGVGEMLGISPLDTMMKALSRHFLDPRLRQLFGRYATYCGSSPYLCPATLMLVAHVERDGVWLVEGGMHALARALAGLAQARGVAFRYGAQVDRIETAAGRASGVVLAGGERLRADAVVVNADAAALPALCFGEAVGRAVAAYRPAQRSLSALTWVMRARTSGFPLSRHNVFFQEDYASEFADVFGGRVLPGRPTVYVCAQDRDHGAAPDGPERLLVLVNAPADGDSKPLTRMEIEQCGRRAFSHMERCGLHVDRTLAEVVVTGPAEFNALFPATGGALYGRAVHGPMATFQRPGARTKIQGLYLAGGSTHPGAGVPMAALSGRLAAASLISDGRLTRTSGRVAMSGGILTH
jgi:1-hydroxycarotenoid 3,4-desaturase